MQETFQALLGLFLEGRGYSLPHHCQTKSESAISRFLNHYKWSTLGVIRAVRTAAVNLILSHCHSKKKPILQVAVDLTTLEKVGKFQQLQDLIRVYHQWTTYCRDVFSFRKMAYSLGIQSLSRQGYTVTCTVSYASAQNSSESSDAKISGLSTRRYRFWHN